MARRDEILEVARDLFLESGLEGLTMRRVARRVGISAPAIYRHFKNKNEILQHIVDQARRRFQERYFRARRGRSPKQRLRLAVRHYIDFALEHPHDYKIIFSSADSIEYGVHTFDYSAEAIDGDGPSWIFAAEQIEACLPGSRRKPKAIEELTLLVWTQVHGLATAYISGGYDERASLEEYRRLCRRLTDLLLEKILD